MSPSAAVGLACSLLETGLTAGILLGSLVATLVTRNLSPEEVQAWGWRLPFLLGGVFGLVIVYLRRWLRKPRYSRNPPAQADQHDADPRRGAALPRRRGGFGDRRVDAHAAMVVVLLMTPTCWSNSTTCRWSAALQANTAATIGLCVSVVLAGMACDRFGAAWVAGLGTPLLIASVYALYLGVAHDPALVLPLYALAGSSRG